MIVKPRSWWQGTRKPLTIIGFVAALVVVALIFLEVIIYGTGFAGKTLWDWLQLLIVPALLSIGAVWFTARNNHDREIALDNHRETAFQDYLDKMSELLLEKQLRESQPGDEVRQIARVRTLSLLRQLDRDRKVSVIQFLSESHLLPLVDLSHADLSDTNLLQANLIGANLFRANLRKANLFQATLNSVNLSEAYMPEVDLRGASLKNADLSGANVCFADLRGANLREAILEHKTTGMQAQLEGTIYNKKSVSLRNPLLGKHITFLEPTRWPDKFGQEAAKAAGAICVDG